MSDAAGDLIVDHLYKEYPTPSEPLVVIRDVSFSLERGEALAVMGPSGSGKSTCFMCWARWSPPPAAPSPSTGPTPLRSVKAELASFRNRQVGFVFQDHHLLPQCSALENVLIPTMAPGAAYSGEEAETRARELLAPGRLERPP